MLVLNWGYPWYRDLSECEDQNRDCGVQVEENECSIKIQAECCNFDPNRAVRSDRQVTNFQLLRRGPARVRSDCNQGIVCEQSPRGGRLHAWRSVLSRKVVQTYSYRV
jgi:hypothetical protein